METQTTELKVIEINAVEVFSDVRGQLEKLAEENERLAFDYRPLHWRNT